MSPFADIWLHPSPQPKWRITLKTMSLCTYSLSCYSILTLPCCRLCRTASLSYTSITVARGFATFILFDFRSKLQSAGNLHSCDQPDFCLRCADWCRVSEFPDVRLWCRYSTRYSFDLCLLCRVRVFISLLYHLHTHLIALFMFSTWFCLSV